ncbi:interleukin-10 receptor subunit beta [Dicentrarchus labrax]|uniref:Fibronectin type-III domain-containing protein n=1 Tax=Dicentrarchus labrax TaxID=13489 RepID=A0A8P4KSY9_DICLA|nr:interleukin-10 receptor subunit beta [Dicentrarchus labrax]
MSAAFIATFLLFCLQTNPVGAEVAAPQNVTMVTLNTNYTLSWDWDQSAGSHAVTFTTEYVAKFNLKYKKKDPKWLVVCDKTSHHSCDLTHRNLNYLGIYMIRVCANVNGSHSDWVHMEFCPDKNAALGPPSKVNLTLAGSTLDVSIHDPLDSTNTSMKEKIPLLYYHIVYWEGSAHTQASGDQTLTTSANLVTLPDLKSWTSYCVSVQSRYEYYNKSSSFTSPLCMQTAGAIPWWVIFLSFLGSLIFFFTIVLLAIFGFMKIYKTIKTVFYPSNQLPPHLKEYLCDSPASDVPRLLASPDSESELLCDKVIICPVQVLEIHFPPPEALAAPPSGLEPDSSGRHSRQGSSGSGDSGVYSTGGSSGLRQPNSNQSGVSGQSMLSAETSWQGPFDSEQVKMRDMTPGLKRQPLITDEGIVDMCV